MAKSFQDFKDLISTIYQGENVPNDAVRYWQAEMLNNNLSWAEVGGKISYWKRQGRRLSDYGQGALKISTLNVKALQKPALTKEAPLLSIGKPKIEVPIKQAVEVLATKEPILNTFMSPPRFSGTEKYNEWMATNTNTGKKPKEKIMKANKIPIGGSIEFGTKGTRNLFLPFVVVAGIVLVLLKLK